MVNEINPPRMVKASQEVKLNDVCKLLCGQVGDAAVCVVPNARTIGIFIATIPILIKAVASGLQQSLNGTEEGALSVEAVIDGTSRRSVDQVVEMGE